MRVDIPQAAVRRLSKMPPAEQREWLSKCPPTETLILDAAFEAWIAEGQLPPSPDGWRVWLMMAGRGFGKTRAGAEWIHRLAWSRRVRIALVGASIDEARAVMVEGVSGLLSVARRQRHKLKWEPSLGRLTWPRGSVAQLYSGDNADGLRGPEHDFAWFLTFEIEAGAAPRQLGAILDDASEAIIQSDSAALIDGYAAHGSSIKSALEPLVRHFGLELFDDGNVLRPATPGPALVLSEDDLGNSAGGERAERIERTQAAARSLPVALTLAYYDPSRDYQTGQMRATIGEAGGVHESSELAVVVSADSARALVESELARRWAKRDQLTLRLPPRCMVVEPGSVVELASIPSHWTVEKCVIEAMVAVVQLRAAWSSVGSIAADPGRSLPSPDVVQGDITFALFDLPDLGVESSSELAVHLAAASAEAGWRPVPIEIMAGGALDSGSTAARETVLGEALTLLPAGQPHLRDLTNSFEVELVDESHWLESCDDQALTMGANLAVLGSELVQFGTAVPLGARRFRLSRLLRGRRGSEWAMGSHAVGDAFALLLPGTFQRIALTASLRGSTVEARSARPGDTGPPVSAVAAGEALRPPWPVHLKATQSTGGQLEASWIRRSRHGWAWLDDMEAPLGEARELYRVALDGTLGRIEAETSAAAIIFTAAQLAPLGIGSATLSVQQLGDLATSRAASLPITLT